MAEPTIKFEGDFSKIENDINKKFGHCCKLIGRVKWRKKFNNKRNLSNTFGRWNR